MVIMQEKTLLKIAFICSLAGVILLFLISESLESENKSLQLQDPENLQDFVVLQGEVLQITKGEDAVFLKIRTGEIVPVTLFQGKLLFELNKGDKVEIKGRLDEFEGRKTIIAEEVRAI